MYSTDLIFNETLHLRRFQINDQKTIHIMPIVNDDIFPKQLPKVVVMFEINLQMGISLCEEMSL